MLLMTFILCLLTLSVLTALVPHPYPVHRRVPMHPSIIPIVFPVLNIPLNEWPLDLITKFMRQYISVIGYYQIVKIYLIFI